MKKLTLYLLLFALLFSLVSCLNTGDGTETTTDSESESETTTPAESESNSTDSTGDLASQPPTDRRFYDFDSYEELQNAFSNVEESEIFKELEMFKESKAFHYISVWGEALIHQLHEEGHVRVPYFENQIAELDHVTFYTTGFSCYKLPQFFCLFKYGDRFVRIAISYPELWYQGLCELEYPQFVERCHGNEHPKYGKVGDFDFELRDMTVTGRVYEPSNSVLRHVAFMYDGLLVYISATEELPDEFFKAFYIE